MTKPAHELGQLADGQRRRAIRMGLVLDILEHSG